MRNKILKITGIFLLILVAFILLIPTLFGTHIINLVKKEINNNVNAKVEFADGNLSLLRHFPNISIRLERVSIANTNEFAGDTLLAASSIDVAVNLFSVIRGSNIRVNGIYLDSPRINAIINKEGKANWEIAKNDGVGSETATTDEASFNLSLRKYEIRNGYIKYNDQSTGTLAEFAGLNHSGSGNFSRDLFTLQTETQTSQASFTYANLPYLINTNTKITANIRVDNNNSKYSFKTDEIYVNKLRLSADGFFQLLNDSTYFMDIRFVAPNNDIKELVSLIPGVYQNEFDKLNTTGMAELNGYVKGIYSPQQMPAYDVNISVVDGSFHYADLPGTISKINFGMKVNNPDGQNDNLVVKVPRGHFEMGTESVDFHFLFRNPESKQYVEAGIKGDINLSTLSQFVKLNNGTRISGNISADANFKGSLLTQDGKHPDFTGNGTFEGKNLNYSSKEFPQPLQNGKFRIDVVNHNGIANNTSINLYNGHIEIGKDPLDFTLQVNKPLTDLLFSGSAKGRFTMDNVKQFVDLQGASLTGRVNGDISFAGDRKSITNSEYEKLQLSGTVSLSEVAYKSKDYPSGVNIATAKLGFVNGNALVHHLNASYLGSNFSMNGVLNNLVKYGMGKGILEGTLNASVDKMNLNDWMTEQSVTTATVSAPASNAFVVPADLDLELVARAKQVTYDNVEYRNILGVLEIVDETINLKNLKTNALDGEITFNGSYSTRASKQTPQVLINYDVNNLSVQKTFTAFNTVKELMPIAQFISGKVSSEMAMIGSLDQKMMPQLSSLSGKGDLFLVQGVLKNFAPLEKIASTLQIAELKQLTIKDISNTFELANGKVTVKPFSIKVKDIEMEISGMHGIDKTMDYTVMMKLPKKYLGEQGNNLVNELTMKAQSSGIALKPGETVNMNIRLVGSIANPAMTADLKETAESAAQDVRNQVTAMATEAKDSVKQMVKDSAKSVGTAVLNNVKSQLINKDSPTANSVNVKKTGEALKSNVQNMFKKKKNGNN